MSLMHRWNPFMKKLVSTVLISTLLVSTYPVAWAEGGSGFISSTQPQQTLIDRPVAIKIDNGGNMYVADYGTHRIVKLDANGDFLTEWGGLGSGDGQFNYPSGIAFDNNANVYVVDRQNHRIQKFDSEGNYLTKWGSVGFNDGEFRNPANIEIDGNTSIVYVTDRDNHRVQKFDLNGQFLGKWGSYGTGDGEFNRPYGLAIDQNGIVYVTESENHRIQKFNTDGTYISQWGSHGDGNGQFRHPFDIAVDNSGYAYVSDAQNNRVQKFDLDGTYISQWGSLGNRNGQFNFPNSIAIDSSGNVYVTGANNERIQKFDPDGDYLDGWPKGTPSITPNSQAFDKNESGLHYRDINVTLEEKGHVLSGILNGSTTLIEGSDYLRASNTFTITKEYLATLSIGQNVLIFDFSTGPQLPLTIDISNSTPIPTPTPTPTPIPIVIPTPINPEPPVTGVDVRIDGKKAAAEIVSVTRSTQDRRGELVIVLNQGKLAEQLASVEPGAVITMQVNSQADAEVYLELSGTQLEYLSAQQIVLELQSSKGIYRVPVQAIDLQRMQDESGKPITMLQQLQVRLGIGDAEETLLNVAERAAEENGLTLIAKPVHFTLLAYLGDKQWELMNDRFVQTMIKLPESILPAQVTTAIALDQDGAIRHVPTKVSTIDGNRYAVISSLTNDTYAVISHSRTFKDVQAQWAQSAVNEMGARFIVQGDSGGLFHPDHDITRAEFAAVLVNGLGLKRAGKSLSPYPDVQPSAWYSDVIQIAYEYSLISGFEDGTFRPEDKLTREQAMKVISNAMKLTKLKDKRAVQVVEQLLAPFNDANEAGEWARSSIADNLNAGIITGRDSHTLAPKAFITRAEVAVMVQRLLRASELID
ncbi:6-bladed beta-propeller [Paenibacillaceae bacterium]|nr:6-bladed beta-propeller [Paenibacillaceae bacterium]